MAQHKPLSDRMSMHMSAARGWSVNTRAGDLRVAWPARLHRFSSGTASLSMILTTCMHNRMSLCSIGCHWVHHSGQLTFASRQLEEGCNRMLTLSPYKAILGVIGCHWAILGIFGYQLVLLGTVGYFWVSSGQGATAETTAEQVVQ